MCRATFLEMDLTPLVLLLSEQRLCICWFSFVSPSVSKYITQGQTKDRETFKKRGGGRKSGREEGRRELRELIILFNHILDGSQVVCGTESKTERVSEERSVRETM